MNNWITRYIANYKAKRKETLANLAKQELTIREGKDKIYIVCNGVAVDYCNGVCSVDTLLDRINKMREIAKEYVVNEN